MAEIQLNGNLVWCHPKNRANSLGPLMQVRVILMPQQMAKIAVTARGRRDQTSQIGYRPYCYPTSDDFLSAEFACSSSYLLRWVKLVRPMSRMIRKQRVSIRRYLVSLPFVQIHHLPLSRKLFSLLRRPIPSVSSSLPISSLALQEGYINSSCHSLDTYCPIFLAQQISIKHAFVQRLGSCGQRELCSRPVQGFQLW